MNTPNNQRKKESKRKIEKALIELLQTKELSEINVTELVKKAQINHSTFYVKSHKLKEKAAYLYYFFYFFRIIDLNSYKDFTFAKI